MARGVCVVRWCTRPSAGRGLCKTCWQWWDRQGRPDISFVDFPRRKYGVNKGMCLVPWCIRPRRAKGLCESCYRWCKRHLPSMDPFDVPYREPRPYVRQSDKPSRRATVRKVVKVTKPKPEPRTQVERPQCYTCGEPKAKHTQAQRRACAHSLITQE